MVLQFADGRPFATGACPYRDEADADREGTARIVVAVSIGGIQTQAVVDTGGVYFICDPGIADLVDLKSSASFDTDKVSIRGWVYEGALHRIMMALSAEQGESYELQVTAFVPQLALGQEWPRLSFLGLRGCLEFFRFAVDPGANAFYFGPS
jgi:hypothetical protein